MITLESIHKDKFTTIYSVSLFLYYIHSMHPWFLLWLPKIWASIAFLAVTLYANNKNYFARQRNYLSIILFSVFFIWMKKDGNINGIIESFIDAYIFSRILSLKKDIMLYNLEFVTKWMAILVFVSAVAFIIHMIGVPLPHQPLFGEGVFSSIETENYYLFLYGSSFNDFARFRAVFYEPGYLTLGVYMLIFLNKFNIRNKYVLMLLFAQLLSFSLAGLILITVGYLFSLFIASRKNDRSNKLVNGLFIIGAFYIIVTTFGVTYFEEAILRRLEWVDGTIAGNNRSSIYLDDLYESMMNSADKWTGVTYNADYSEKGVSGYKLFAVQNGMIGVVLLLLSFISLVPFKKLGLNWMTGALIMIFLILYQNAYPTAFCILFPAACIKNAFDEDYQCSM